MKQTKRRKKIIDSRKNLRNTKDYNTFSHYEHGRTFDMSGVIFVDSDKKYKEDVTYVAGIKYKGITAKFLKDYVRAIASKARRPFSLKYFNKGYNLSDLMEYDYEIKKAEFISNPKNQETLILINKLYLESIFGLGEALRYGIPNSYKVSDIPDDLPSREAERFVFIHGDNYHTALLDAPKYFIEDWNVRVNDRCHKIETRKCLLKIDDEILLGEVTKETQHMYDSISKNAKSGIKFCIYYKGKEEGKFVVDRWDYLPLSEHHNKFYKDGTFCFYGITVPNTKLSHRHLNNLHNRLVLTQNQSPDIEPTIINQGNEYGVEHSYKDFNDFCDVFEKFLNFQTGKIPEHDLCRHGLKKVGRMYCLQYDKHTHTTCRHEVLDKIIYSEHKESDEPTSFYSDCRSSNMNFDLSDCGIDENFVCELNMEIVNNQNLNSQQQDQTKTKENTFLKESTNEENSQEK